MSETELLEAKHLSKFYNKRPVVRDVSLKLRPGEAVALLGPNGAGKTTCFSMIAGLVKCDSGLLRVDNHDITYLPMYRRARIGIGYLPQESSIFRGLNVEDNIRSVLEVSTKSRDEQNKRLESLLAEFGVTHLRYAEGVALSGGERRRVEIARCLANNPKYIMLDEPLAGIDPVAVADIKKLIFHLKNKGIGILITDHNVKETLDIVDRAYVMYDGQVLMEGLPEEIILSSEVKQVYLGDNFSL